MRVHRVEVRNQQGQPDPEARAALAAAQTTMGGVEAVRTARVYLIEAALTPDTLQAIVDELLTDPVAEQAVIGTAALTPNASTVEVHYQAGVMDPVAQSAQEAIAEMLPGLAPESVSVCTGRRYDLTPQTGVAITADALEQLAATALANPVIQDIHLSPYHPDSFAHGHAYTLTITRVPIRGLDDPGLAKLSKEGHLFLNLDEMRAIQQHYQGLNREPTDIELETLAQTWSEHCVHKTLKAKIHYTQPIGADTDSDANTPGPADWADRPGHTVNADVTLTIDNLLKRTIAAATFKLMEDPHYKDWCVSVFEDNAGIVKFDDQDAVCIKVETHNHPSAIEPYGGAATGIGGCIRDIMGTGLSARPIANTDVFCVAQPNLEADRVPAGVIPPRRVLEGVVSGVRDYGNRMGIPTINGAVWFHNDYLGNPLVFAGCVGLMPLDKCFGSPKPGDRIIALGGRTGRDGIHGATFSSAELTDTHANEFGHAVQIGNAITQKKTLDVILQARDHASGCLFNAITDCGAGGFSSAVGEMGCELGARVTLDTAPLKYQGLTYTEIWISEAQERMVLAVPESRINTLRAMCDAEDVEFCDLGHFGENGDDKDKQPTLVLTYHGTEVGSLSMHFVHDGIPKPTRNATWPPPRKFENQPTGASHSKTTSDQTITQSLYTLLGHPNIASKHWIIRQYDHEVQGTSVVKPLVGPEQSGPSDAAVVRPKHDSERGVAIACGMQPGLGEKTPGGDSYWMTLAAIDEAVRNCVCVGADPSRIAILDNFCWPSCDDPAQLGSLVRAAEACYDGALAYRTPFVSGKDSLNNQFVTDSGKLITIPPTLLITAMGIVTDVCRCVTMDAKAPGNKLIVVGVTTSHLGGSHYLAPAPGSAPGSNTGCDGAIPRVDLGVGPKSATAIGALIADGLVRSAHDCSDGGLLVAAAEMAFAGGVGLDLDLDKVPVSDTATPLEAVCFAETPSRYLIEVTPDRLDAVTRSLNQAGATFACIGTFTDRSTLTARHADRGQVLDEPLAKLRDAWLAPLDW